MKKLDIGFIGVGEMAGAILETMLKEGTFAPEEIGVCDSSLKVMKRYEEKGCTLFLKIADLVATCKNVILGVRPQNFASIMPDVKKTLDKNTVLISMISGIGGEEIQKAVGFSCKVVLIMPNTPMFVGKGSTAMAACPPITRTEFEHIKAIFPGFVQEILPTQLTEIIPVNGSSPAFVYEFARVLIAKAVEYGIEKDAARNLVCKTLAGSAEMILKSGKSEEELINMVCSPGGITLEGMKVLNNSGFASSIAQAFDACIDRAKELAGESIEGNQTMYSE